MAEDVEKSTVEITLSANLDNADNDLMLEAVLMELADKFEVLDVRITAGLKTDATLEPKSKEENDDISMQELQERIKRYRHELFRFSTSQRETSPRVHNHIPAVSEKMLLEALDALNGFEIETLIYTNQGVTKKVLLKAMNYACMPKSPFMSQSKEIITAIKNHSLCDDDILWIGIRSPLASVRLMVINKANQQMLRFLLTNREFQPLSKTTKKAIQQRKRRLSNT